MTEIAGGFFVVVYWVMSDLPQLALSIRQPWAWAVVAGHKVIENRSAGAIKSGKMTPGWICVHAAVGLSRDEFRWGHWRLQKHGVECPRPEKLIRGAVIGIVEVVDIVDRSDSEWFGGPMGLVLENARPIAPIPAKGALGYFEWSPGRDLAPVIPWMKDYDALTGTPEQPDLFGGLPVSFAQTPSRPGRKRS